MADLHREGIRVIMLTGDNPITADAVARQVGVDEVHAEMRPGDKADFVARLKASGARVALAGDGINDAPAPAAPDVGLPMATAPDPPLQRPALPPTPPPPPPP